MGSPAAGTGETRRLEITFSGTWPPHTSAEGGQVEPVLGGFFLMVANGLGIVVL